MTDTNINHEDLDDNINYKDIFSKVYKKWKLFSVLIFFSLLTATIYLRYEIPHYESTATILIKNNQKGGSGMSETSVFEDLSIFSDRNSIENEKAILSSRNMMRNVVEKLDLCHEYYQIGNLIFKI